MKGDKEIIEALNGVLANELTAIKQYFLHARMLQDWGLEKLGKLEYDASIDEMKHADEIIKRILFLEGLPNLQKLNRLKIGQNIEELIAADLEVEYKDGKDLSLSTAIGYYKTGGKASHADRPNTYVAWQKNGEEFSVPYVYAQQLVNFYPYKNGNFKLHLAFGPRPVVSAHPDSNIVIICQSPGTLASMVMNVTRCEMHVANGDPSETDFVTHKFD